MLDEAALVRAMISTHWVGMVLALGTAVIADALGLGILLSRMRGSRRTFKRLHQVVGVALFLLLFSGGGLIALRSGAWCELDSSAIIRFGDTCVPTKVVAKLILIGVLVSVALLIDSYVLPLSKRSERPLLPCLSPWEVVRAALIGGASLICWISLATIPLVKELHRWPLLHLLESVAITWAAAAVCLSSALIALRFVLIGRNQTSAERPSRTTGNLHAARHKRGSPCVSDDVSPRPVTVEAAFAACRRAVLGNAVISFVINLLMLAGPLYMLQVYDRVLTSRSLETLTVLTILLVGLYFFLGMLDLIRTRILARISLRVDRLLGPSLFAGAIGTTAASPNPAATQPLRDLEQVRQFISGPAVPALFDLPWAPLYIGLVFLLHPLLGIVALSGMGILIALSILNQVVTRKPFARAAEDLTKTHTMVEAGRRDAETLRAMAMVEAHRTRWLEAHRDALSRQLQAADIASGFSVSIKTGRLLLQSIILGTGAYLSLNEAMSPGAMIASSIIATRALAPVEQLIAQWRSLVSTSSAVQRCRASLSISCPPPQQAFILPEPRGYLEVSKLYVSAPGRTEPVLKGLNFRLEPGDALAVIGPSASGKSTLARALVGVLPIRHGEIRLDGADLTQWDPQHLGKQIGYLPQDVTLFDGTILENIARLDPDPNPRAVLSAATAASVHKMILRLEQGYGTRVGEGGAVLSGGQRQRIALARAFYGNPALMVMDEPNANLDAEGEAALVAAIRHARGAGRTVIVMAHRQSVLAAVNRVLILKDGRQVAFGSPGEIVIKARMRNREPRYGNTPAIKLAAASKR